METHLFKQIEEGTLDFSGIEQIMWRALLSLFQHFMEKILVEIDKYLMATRDPARYEFKERKCRTIETLVGPVEVERRYYRDKKENRWVYLLDEVLQLEQYKAISPGLLKLAVLWATKGPSYRDARDRLADLYGMQVLSHEAIRRALLEVGAVTERDEENKVVKEQGKRKVKALFIEVDGFGARLQKVKKGEKRRKEVKLAVIHEGWTHRQGQGKKKDYRLVNPQYIAITKESKDFWEKVRGYLQSKYKDIDSILIIINGDGASWIREGANYFGKGLYQYDRFHVARALREALREHPEALKDARRALHANDTGQLLCIVVKAWKKALQGEQRDKLAELKSMLVENHEFIRDYRLRLKEAGHQVNASWRSMGAAESNVNKFKNRTAKRGRAWSMQGLQAILTMLSNLYEGNLSEQLSRHLAYREEWILDRIKAGAGHIAKNIPTKHLAPRGGFPAIHHGTEGYAALFKEILRPDSL